MANRYWRGGAGTWNSTNTANWSDQSGGLGGFSVPTSADDVFFDSASNATSYTVTTSGNTTDMVCRSLNVAGPATGTLTFSNTNSQVNIYGNLIHAASGVNWGASVGLWFQSTSTGNTITTNGYSFANNWGFNGVGGSWILQDNVTIAANRTATLTNGTLNLNNNTFSVGLFSSSNANTRTISFGTGNITLTGNNSTIFNAPNQTGLSFTGTPTFNATYSGAVGTRTFRLGNSPAAFLEASAINLNITAGTDIVNCSVAAKNLNFTGFAGSFVNSITYVYNNLTISTGMTITGSANGFVFAATTGTQQITTNGRTIDCPLTFNGIGGTFAFQDALTQGDTRNFTVTNGTVQLKNGVTSTVGNFVTTGTTQKSLQSTLAGSQATISEASGTVDASYLTIQDINATGGATWNAYVDNNNVDAGNNDGWDFGISPVVGGAEYTYTLRSFTQPRRF